MNDPSSERVRLRRLRANAPYLLELLALTGIAIAQPVLDVLGNSPESLIQHRASDAAIVVATVVIVFGPALVLGGLELLVARVHPRARDSVHVVLLALLTGVLAVEVAKRSTAFGPRSLIACGIAGALLAAGLTRIGVVRLWLRYLALAPLIFAVLFLSTSPVRDLLVEPTGRTADVAVPRPVPIVMVMLDEFPLISMLDGSGKIDRNLYPNLAALADGANWYRNDTTVATQTVDAVPAILTGRYPVRFGVPPTLARLPENLFTLLGQTYEIHASEAVTALCPPGLCREPAGRTHRSLGPILGDAFEVLRERVSPNRSTTPVQVGGGILGEPDAPARVRTFLRSLGRSTKPRLDFIHLLLPHAAWQYLPSGQSYDAPHPPEGFAFFQWGNDTVAAAARQRHLLQVQYTDAVVGQVIARMKALGTYEKSLFVVTADHGVGFTAEESMRAIYSKNYEEILWTPLFAKFPGQTRGEISDRQVRSIDVVPTIADVLGIKLPWRVDGVSVLRSRPERDQLRVMGWPGYDKLKSDPNGFLRLEARTGFAHVLRAAVPKGDGSTDLALYQIGRLGNLVGREVDQLPSGGPARSTVRLDEPDRWNDVNPRGAEIPVYVSGAIRTREPVTVAVSVNGVLGGWSDTYPEVKGNSQLNRRRFFTLIPPQLLRAGNNDVRVLVVADDGGTVSLSPVPFASPR